MLYFTYIFHVIPKYFGKCIRGESSHDLRKANLSSLLFSNCICWCKTFKYLDISYFYNRSYIYIYIYYSPGDLQNQKQYNKQNRILKCDFLFCLSNTRSHNVAVNGLEFICRPSWLQTLRDPPAFASEVMGTKVYAIRNKYVHIEREHWLPTKYFQN